MCAVTSRATTIAVSRLPSTRVGRSASKAGDVRTASGARPVTRARAREYLKKWTRSEEHTSELQSQSNLVCRLLLEKKKKKKNTFFMFTNRHSSTVYIRSTP